MSESALLILIAVLVCALGLVIMVSGIRSGVARSRLSQGFGIVGTVASIAGLIITLTGAATAANVAVNGPNTILPNRDESSAGGSTTSTSGILTGSTLPNTGGSGAPGESPDPGSTPGSPVAPGSVAAGGGAPGGGLPTPTPTTPSVTTAAPFRALPRFLSYDWTKLSATRNGVDLKVDLGPKGWVEQPFVPNHSHLSQVNFIAGCGGSSCDADVHLYSDRDRNHTSCIQRVHIVGKSVEAEAVFSRGACTFDPKSNYHFIQFFNLSDTTVLTVYLVDNNNGNGADFAFGYKTMHGKTAVRSKIWTQD